MRTETHPFFSVVIPLYNRRNIIAKTLDSVLSQTYDSFEIVLVDDGSGDHPEEVISQLNEPRIRLIRQENAGGSAARNRGIDEARGAYIAFLDSDDAFLPDHLASMKSLIDGTENTAAYSPIIVDRGNGKTFIKPPRPLGKDEAMADYLMRDRGFVQTSGLVVPTEVARKVRYRLGLPFGQDTDFAIRLHLAGCRFVMSRQASVIWNDAFDPARVSSARKGHRVIDWLEEMKPFISTKAYLGYRGWHVAKGIAPKNPLLAIYYYFQALLKGCYRPKLAVAVLLQIVLPTTLYRNVADRIVGVTGSSP
jgi:glycosyltransferase involved in cell wall biosynthesis